MGNHPDDRIEPEIVSAGTMYWLWRWANAEVQQTKAELDKEKELKDEE